MTPGKKIVFLSAGGTGGHVAPAAALAHDLLARGFDVRLVTDKRGQKMSSLYSGVSTTVIHAGTMGSGIAAKVKGAVNLGLGLIESFSLIRRLKPALVIGFGGYPSVPAVFMAQHLNIPTIIHEQNAVLGRANAFLARRAGKIALSFPMQSGFHAVAPTVVTGNPVRAEIAALSMRPYPALVPGGPVKIFLMGGSLGASVFSRVVPAALSRLPGAQAARLEVIQQCRAEDIESVQGLYDAAGIRCRLQPFFDDVPEILAQCHLVISRSGASTVAEVTAAGRPAIFVPYPYHADQQQKVNADAVADAGGGWVMTEDSFTEDSLLARIEVFLQSPEILFRAAEAARGRGRPDAARLLGNLVMETVSGWQGEAPRKAA